MPAWQIALEFVKTAGVGSLLGVLLGFGATRRQKSREAMVTIKSANYREVVERYRELLAKLLQIKDHGRSVFAAAEMIAMGSEQEDRSIEFDKFTTEQFDLRQKAYDESLEGLEVLVASLIVHRSETKFHSYANHVVECTHIASSALMYFRHMASNSAGLEHIRADLKRSEEAIGLLGLLWDEWKIEAEREAAGLRPVPRLNRSRLRLRLDRRL